MVLLPGPRAAIWEGQAAAVTGRAATKARPAAEAPRTNVVRAADCRVANSPRERYVRDSTRMNSAIPPRSTTRRRS
jgi:hypothetical protein